MHAEGTNACEYAVEMIGITKRFPGIVANDNITLQLKKGEIHALLGENGAGKSTLMRIMAGLSRPSAGRVRQAESGARSGGLRLGYLGHATFLYPGLTALENLAFWRTAHGLRLSRADLSAGLERVGLGAHAHERAGVFSRGMAQRLNLARVLMLEPDLLLLDEPGTGLDAASLALLRREVRDARQRGACVVLISHDLAGDAPLADRLLALAERKLVYDGAPSDFTGFHTAPDAAAAGNTDKADRGGPACCA